MTNDANDYEGLRNVSYWKNLHLAVNMSIVRFISDITSTHDTNTTMRLNVSRKVPKI